MKVIILKNWMIKSALLLIGVFFLWSIYQLDLIPVYRDREHWEKIGAIVWEADVQEKLIALTFDDGPSPTFTNKIMDLLKQYGAKATFFVIGKEAEKHPEIVQREVALGNEIGNHTFQHNEVNRMNCDDLKADLELAHQIIYKITQQSMKLFRPTSGFYNEKIVNVAKSLNYTVIIWTWGQDSRDWTGISGERIAFKIIKSVKPGDIILFHDRGGDHSNTVRALEILMPILKEQGYQFVTVSALLQKSLTPNTQSAK